MLCGCAADLESGKLAQSSEGQIKKKKLTSMLRTLSASAASSSARISTKWTGDRSLMVESELGENEANEMKTNDANQSRSSSSSVLRILSLPRGSPYSAVTASSTTASKYSPMSDD